MNIKKIYTITFLVLLVTFISSMIFPMTTRASSYLVFGPEDFSRKTSKPMIEKVFFSVPDENNFYSLRIYNGGIDGQFKHKISSAVISLNGAKIVHPNEFKKKVQLIEKTLSVEEDNNLEVELRGKPGSGITIEIVGVDNVPPTIIATVSPQPNAAGWNNTNVTVSFDCSDSMSGIASCPDPVVIDTEGANQNVVGEATDLAGNSATTSLIVNLDKTAPNVELTAPADKADSCSYTLEGGASFTHYEPMRIQGTTLTNDLTTFSVPIIGTGSTLTLYLYANVDGDSETFAFQNIIISGQSGFDAYDAYDMWRLLEDGSKNLISYTNPFNDAFASAEDGFQKYQRGVSPSIPSAVLDNSLLVSPTDSLGIIKEGNTDTFFGVVDTVNPQNTGGSAGASWTFNIGGATGLVLSIDMGAMGDFESSDHFEWTYQIDDGPVMEAFSSTVDITEITGYPSPLEIKGDASDDLSGIAALYCNGSLLPPVGSTFACDVPMVNGDNQINITATDLAGNASSSEMDVLFYDPELELAYADDFELIWSDYGSAGNFHATFFRPLLEDGFHALGHFGHPLLITNPNGYMLVAKELKPGALAQPTGYEMVWISYGLGSELPVTIWRPIPPEGYVSLGLVVKTGTDFLTSPDVGEVSCVRADLTVDGIQGNFIWNNANTPSLTPFGSWQVIPDRKNTQEEEGENGVYIGTFSGSNNWNAADPHLLFTINKKWIKRVDLAPEDVEPLIEEHGPVLSLHSLELYFPDHPEPVLDQANLDWGLVYNEYNHDLFYILHHYSKETSSEFLMDDFNGYVATDPNYLTNPSFRYWLNINQDSVYGNLSRSEAIINVLPMDVLFTDIQFWFFYPFNGPGRARTTVLGAPYDMGVDKQLSLSGRHYGDWEQVTLRILNSSKELVAVYMSRHSAGQWFSRSSFDNVLEFWDGHPLVYSAKYSHAHYPFANTHNIYLVKHKVAPGLGIVQSTWLFDQTNMGYLFYAYNNYMIVNSGIAGVPVVDKSWMNFTGRWGQYEKLNEIVFEEVGMGPTGPIIKHEWKHSGPDFDWFWAPLIKYEDIY